MIEPKNQKLSISRQCKVLNVSRSSFYYHPKPIKQEDLDLMRKIDELYLENPSSGSRTIRRQLKRQGIIASRKKIQRLMRLMGIEAVYPKPRTSRPHPQHRVYPYLLRNLTINRPNQVWAADITYSAPRLGNSRGAYLWNASNQLPCSLLWKSMSPSGGDLLLTGRVT